MHSGTQARLRWTGEKANLEKEEQEVQWAMNFTAGWIGVYKEKYRDRCIKLGKQTGHYKGEKVAKGCTPNYLPEFIEMEVTKRLNK